MKRLSFMVVAGEASGDTLAAELVRALREEAAAFQSRSTADLQPLYTALDPVFFGAGGPAMAAAGVDLAVDMSAHTVFGIVDVFKRLGQFVKLRNRLARLAIERQPDVIICVDFSGFNRRLARAIRNHVRAGQRSFGTWRPRIVQYISPQVWASRPGRTRTMTEDLDLLLSIFPFEEAWYARHAPGLKVRFVGHPLLDRYSAPPADDSSWQPSATAKAASIVLLPGSRRKELKRHLPVMLAAAQKIRESRRAAFRMVLPDGSLASLAQAAPAPGLPLEFQTGGLAAALARADLAIASSGTVTMECAFFGVPAVVLYKLSSAEFQIARRMVSVKYIAMPNLLADEAIYPEFIQHQATPEVLAAAALDLLNDPARRAAVKARLKQVIASLGGPGAARRAAREIVSLL